MFTSVGKSTTSKMSHQPIYHELSIPIHPFAVQIKVLQIMAMATPQQPQHFFCQMWPQQIAQDGIALTVQMQPTSAGGGTVWLVGWLVVFAKKKNSCSMVEDV